MCVRVCVCACTCACACVCVCVCVRVFGLMRLRASVCVALCSIQNVRMFTSYILGEFHI